MYRKPSGIYKTSIQLSFGKLQGKSQYIKVNCLLIYQEEQPELKLMKHTIYK